jgi:hypothetical protein
MLAEGADAGKRIETIAEGHARSLALEPEAVLAACASAQERLAQLAQAMQIRIGVKARAQRLLAPPAQPESDPLDATLPTIAARLPAWFRERVGAPFALIYAHQAKAGGIELGEKELALLRTLRNQGVMAFRQVG